jgi:hypothetical protein
VGWLGPGLTETYETPDVLAEADIKYVGDRGCDDEPAEIAINHGPLVTLPLHGRKRHPHDDPLVEDAAPAKILSFAIHP